MKAHLGAFAGPVGVFAEVGLYVGWTSMVRNGRRHQQPRVLMTRPAVMPLRSAYHPLNTGGRFSANARWPS
jgi:hypothetical protein